MFERFLRLGYWSDFYIYPLAIVVLLGLGVLKAMHGYSIFSMVGLFLIGYLLWTFIEYWFHRYLFHQLPFVIRDGHTIHHHRPRECLGTPTFVSLPVYFVLVYAPLYFTVGAFFADFVVAGLLAGALSYFIVHHAVHHWRIRPGHIMYGLRRSHAIHHRHQHVNFGVTSPLWDWVFRTRQASLQ